MSENIKSALEILKQAMEIEQEGNLFYLNAAQTTKDKEGKEIFTTLANDEQKHFNLIKREFTALSSEGRWVGSPEMKPMNVDLGKPLFPRSIKELEKAVTTKSNDWDALQFGLGIEIKSYDIYRKMAPQIEDSLGKQMFEFLAGQEMSHFNLLMMRYESLFGPISWRY